MDTNVDKNPSMKATPQPPIPSQSPPQILPTPASTQPLKKVRADGGSGGRPHVSSNRGQDTHSNNSGQPPDDDADTIETLGAVTKRIVQVLLPVTISGLYCCTLIRILSWNLQPTRPNLLDSTWQQLGVHVMTSDGVVKESTSGLSVTENLIVVLVFIVLIILVTLLILFIFYMKWQQCLTYYFYLPSLVILAVVTPAFMRTVFYTLNLFSLDIFILIIFTWNFTILGMMAIFSLYAPAPLCVQQAYLIHNSTMLSVLIIHALPGWAPWLLLAFLIIWDLFAVLAPFGPLNLIINLAEKEGIVEMPGLLYSTEIPSKHDGKLHKSKENDSRQADKRRQQQLDEADNEQSPGKTLEPKTIKSDGNDTRQVTPPGQVTQNNPINIEVNEGPPTPTSTPANTVTTTATARKDGIAKVEARKTFQSHGEQSVGSGQHGDDRGLSIGLGDFIFYGLLIGLASKGRHQTDFYTVITTLISVQFGLVLTLFILAFTKRALPAIPISVGVGVSVAALTYQFVPPLSNRLASASIFI